MIDSNGVYPNARLWSMDALGLIYGINSIVRTNIGERRRTQIVCSNHRYCLDERATTATRPRDDVCTLWSGVGDLEGMYEAFIAVDIGGIGGGMVFIMIDEPRCCLPWQ